MSRGAGTVSRFERWYLGLTFAALVFFLPPVRNLFRLDGSDTVYDFQTSSVEDQVEFLSRACDDGVCINEEDWACGYRFDTSAGDETRDCISAMAMLAKPWVKLDAVRKRCGKQHMKFDEDTGSPEECVELHGVWGRASAPPKVHF